MLEVELEVRAPIRNSNFSLTLFNFFSLHQSFRILLLQQSSNNHARYLCGLYQKFVVLRDNFIQLIFQFQHFTLISISVATP
jgi:hypothetical protein